MSLFPVQGRNVRFPLPPIRPFNSLAAAPRVFTRIIHLFVAKLRSDEIRTVICVDDLLLIYHQKDTLREIFLCVRRILSSLGFETNSSLSLFGCGIRQNLQVISCLARVTDQSDTGNTCLGGLLSLLDRMNHAARTGLLEAPKYYRTQQRQQVLLHQLG